MEPALLELYAEGVPEDEVAIILRLSDPTAIPDGTRIITRMGLIATGRVTRRNIPLVWAARTVESMKAARRYGPTVELEAAFDASDFMPNEHRGYEPGPGDQRRPDAGLPSGEGVVVAHIDWGVDFVHPDFRRPDGRTRLLALWDQAASYDPLHPNKYGYGRIHSAADINLALATPHPYATLGYQPSASDPLGIGSHGTHTLGISCGNGRSGGPLGLAPAADIVFVHFSTSTSEGPTLLGDSVAFLEALDFIRETAGQRPFVINASLGRQCGEHDGLTLTEQGMDAFVRSADGRAICMSTGNYFDRHIHARGTLRPGERRTLHFTIEEADPGPNEVDLWYEGPDRFGVTIHAPGEAAVLHSVPNGMVPLVVGDATIGRLYHRLGDPNNNDNEVSLFLDRGAPRGTWELILEGNDVADGRFHAWIERSSGASRNHARFVADDSDPTSTTGTICNGLWTIAVGAYDAHSPERKLAHFSSSGPTRTGMTKPNLAAPGVRVLSCRSHPRGDAPDPPLLTIMSGTSMAAPHVAGTIALMFAVADRRLSIAETRRLLLSHTDPPPDTMSGADLLRIGGGYLNTSAAVNAAQEAGRAPPTPEETADVVIPPGLLVPEAFVPEAEETIVPDEITAEAASPVVAEALAEAVDWSEADPPPVIEHPLLREGAPGAAVHEAQQKLNRVNANQLAAGQPGIMAAPLNEDGIFGPLTRQATVSFQRLAFPASPPDWDGVIGPKTWQQLDVLAVAPVPVPPAPEPPVPPLPVPPPPVPPVVPGLDPPRWRPILTAVLSPQATMRDGNAVRFLIDGPVTFRSMVEAIRSAQSREHYIYLLGWTLVDDFQMIPGDLTSTFRQLMSDAAARGVQIRAMLWAKPPLDNRDEVARINALPTGGAIRDDETPDPKPPIFGAHHQKLLVVKGSLGLIGFCGGLDINSDRIMIVHRGKGEPLHDVHCRIQGPAAWDALQTFVRRWVHHPDHGGIDLKRGPLLGYTEKPPPLITTPPPGTSSIPGTCSVAIARTFNPVAGGTTLARERDIKQLLLQAISKAQRFIYMEEQYLISLEAAAALRAAVPRLQHLTILIAASEFLAPGPLPDLPCAWKYRRDFIDALTKGLSAADRDKVRIFDRITPPASRPTFGPHTYVHAKTWVFDDELAVIGSANCNRRGWEHDSEVNAFIFDDTALAPGALSFAQSMRMALWSEHLAVPPSAVLDGVASASIWRKPPLGAAVRPYNPTGGRDPFSDITCVLGRGAVDPGLESAEHIALSGGADGNQALRMGTRTG